eukprot:c6621_g1_i1 orf=96-254(-)
MSASYTNASRATPPHISQPEQIWDEQSLKEFFFFFEIEKSYFLISRSCISAS